MKRFSYFYILIISFVRNNYFKDIQLLKCIHYSTFNNKNGRSEIIKNIM